MQKAIGYGSRVFAVLVIVITLAKAAAAFQNLPGLIVEEVTADSPAAKVGLKVGDRLLSYDDRPLLSITALQAAQQNIVGKKEVILRVRRGEKTLTLSVPIGTLGVFFRPEFPQFALTLYIDGLAAWEAERIDEAISKWNIAAKAAMEAEDKVTAAWLYSWVGNGYEKQGKWKEAQEVYVTEWKLLERSSDTAMQSQTLSALGRCSDKLNDFPSAQRWYEQAVQVDETAGNQMWAASNLWYLGNIAYSRGVLQAARDCYNRALAIYERLAPDSLAVADSLTNLGNVAFRDDLQTAQDYFSRALKIYERLDPDSLTVAASLISLGNVTGSRSDFQAAQDYFSRALKIYERLAPGSLDVATSLQDLGNVARDRGDLQAAQDYYNRALKIKARLAPDSLAVAASLSSLGQIALSRDDIQAAQDYYNRDLAIYERLAPGSLDVAGSFINLGNVAHHLDDLQAAQDYFSRALKILQKRYPNSLLFAGSLQSLGNVAFSTGDLQAAQDYYSRALAIFERLAPDSLNAAKNLNSLGHIAHSRGNLQAAQDYYSRVLKIRERLAPGSLDVAGSLLSIGNVAFSTGDLQAAQDYYSRALAIYERLAPGSFDVASSLISLGNVTYLNKNLQAAQDHYSRALAIYERLAPGSLDVAGSLQGLGNVAFSTGDLQAAQDYHSRALAIFERLAPNSLNVSGGLLSLGNVASFRGDLQVAQDYYSRALKINERLAPNSLGAAAGFSNLGGVILSQRRFPEAFQLFTRAVEIIESQRSKILSSDARALLLAQLTGPYTGLLRTHLALNDLPSAFATLERARARSLVEMLTERQIDFHADLPADLLKRQDNLALCRSDAAATLTYAHTQLPKAQTELGKLNPNKDANRIAVLENQIEEFNQQIKKLPDALTQYSVEQRKLDEEIRRAPGVSSRFANLQYPHPLDLAGAQTALAPDTLLLAYHLDHDESYLFAVTKTDIKLFKLPARKVIADSVRAFQSEVAVKRRGLNDLATIKIINEQGKKLYDLLIGPAQALVNQANRVLICPDGPLHTLPFAALVSQIKPAPRYFIQDKPLHTIVSMTVYAQSRKPLALNPNQKKHVLAFGDAVYTDDHAQQIIKQLQNSPKTQHPSESVQESQTRSNADSDTTRWKFDSRLPNTKQEVEAIRRYDKSADIKLAQEVTESAVRLLGKDYTIFHFAVHGWADKRVGLDSGIALSQPRLLGKSETKDDNGMLQAWEIIEQLHLNADLVVLSACETGLGTTELGGEGLVGLTRAFQYAGAKSIVVSLWKVLDQSTSELMMAFYDELFKGASKDVALQKAMAKVRSNPKWRHPYYWSSFVLVGDWQ